jgi:hypothetical protein
MVAQPINDQPGHHRAVDLIAEASRISELARPAARDHAVNMKENPPKLIADRNCSTTEVKEKTPADFLDVK